MKIFKYKKEIDLLLSQGYKLPPLIHPDNIEAYRFGFQIETSRNHIPVLIEQPERKLPDSVKLSGYALSCFDSEEKAVKRYKSIERTFPELPTKIGDSLFWGNLDNEDGMVTQPDSETGHFDLYEYINCDLNKTFEFLKLLV